LHPNPHSHNPSFLSSAPSILCPSLHLFSIISIEITVGLQQTSYSALETGGPVSICAQIFLGTLERNVSLILTSMDGNATGSYIIIIL
jgi:hypothetical protein